MRMPKKMLKDLKEVAAYKKMSGYQPLIREYCERGLERDRELMRWSAIGQFQEQLRARGVPEEVLAAALAAVTEKMPF